MLALDLFHHLVLEIRLARPTLIYAIGIRKLNKVFGGLMLQRPSQMIIRELLAVAHSAQLRVEEIGISDLHVGSRGGALVRVRHLQRRLVGEEVKAGLLVLVDIGDQISCRIIGTARLALLLRGPVLIRQLARCIRILLLHAGLLPVLWLLRRTVGERRTALGIE